MPGIRIQHPTARSVTFTLTDGSRPYRERPAGHATDERPHGTASHPPPEG